MNAMHDARPVAVRLDIRPRIVLRDDAPLPKRRGFRLPPLAVPAAGYWLAMGGLTYFFTQLGPHPLDVIEPARASVPAPLDLPPPRAPEPALQAAAPPPLAPPPAAPAPDDAIAPADAPDDGALDDSRAATRPSRARSSGDVSLEPTERATRSEPSGTLDDERGPAALETPRAGLDFPEFTDSSRTPPRERAADGPRIDSLFERAEERPSAGETPSDGPGEPGRGPARAVGSCEAAVARNNEHLEIGGPRGPADISREAYASILQNGSYLVGCNIPERTVFEICTAVKDGRAVGITVVSNPANAAVSSCVRSAVSRLRFPVSPRLDVTHTRFDAVRR